MKVVLLGLDGVTLRRLCVGRRAGGDEGSKEIKGKRRNRKKR